ncbi:MAG: hypothetical protein OEW87_10280, partial [Flavobacteriaceae bacterium]|nr:hypothetical protein [Flavobacteriaceae bacterium]
MSFINSMLKIFVGDKTKKDLKLLQPIIDDVRSFDAQMEKLSIDELRNKTLEFKTKIATATQPFNDQIAELEKEIE